jgi:hypothetical protein
MVMVMAIGIVDEDRATVDSALGHVQRNASKFETWSARHGVAGAGGVDRFTRGRLRRDRQLPHSDAGNARACPA